MQNYDLLFLSCLLFFSISISLFVTFLIFTVLSSSPTVGSYPCSRQITCQNLTPVWSPFFSLMLQ
ncbi:hypothetical protein N665_0348s0005 [Sinapis alba]|nr:hypothetical protein N665_0348s0005 [Sinapis alba]